MTNSVKNKKFVIIDGKSVFYRGYYAMANLSTKDGIPTGGVYGFAAMALQVLKQLKPDYVAVAWDKPKTNIRKRLQMYPQYKAGRKAAPADFYAQIPILHELLEAFGWPLYELDDYEADDIMGTLAVQASKKGLNTMLVTSDLDMLQLVNEHVHVFALKTGISRIELYSPKSFEAKYNIRVDQFLDFKALRGDSSDNIPGVPGIGEKGAIELLQQYKTLDNIYKNLPLLKDSIRKKLESGKDLAYLSKELARIWIDAPVKLDLSEVDGSRVDPLKIREILSKLEFRTLVKQLPEVMQVPADNIHNTFQLTSVSSNILINTNEQLAKLHFAYSKDSKVLIHGRSKGRNGQDPEVIIINFLNQTYTLDLTRLDPIKLKEVLNDLFSMPVVGYDLKNTFRILLQLTIKLPIVDHDVLIGSFLLNSLRRDQSLTSLASQELGYEGSSFEDLDQEEYVLRAPEIMSLIQGLYEHQNTELKKIPKLPALAKEIEWPVIPVLARMEHVGIHVNCQYLNDFSKEIDDLISDYEQQIYGYANREFNISSPSQLAEILFDDMKLSAQGIKKGKTGYSTAASELDKLRSMHPIIDAISQYREVAKLKNTYVDALPKLADSHSRIHTTFNLTIAQTGRLSSTDPNLQNIPIRTDLGRRIRAAFTAESGMKLISADYSQFELRLAAVLANDEELIEMFNRGADIHTTTAAQVYGRSPEDVTKQMRRAAKIINFGILYGMSPHGLSVATGMSREMAVEFIDKYKKLRQPLFNYMDKVLEKARQDNYVETLFGRRRPMPDIHSSNFLVRQSAERAAINMPIQGTEADLMKMAMINCDQLLQEQHNNCNLLLQIHDSIVVECPEEVASNVARLLQTTMQDVYKLPLRLDVDVTIGDNWGEL